MHVSSDAQQFEDVISSLETTRAQLEHERIKASESRKEISALKKELREKQRSLKVLKNVYYRMLIQKLQEFLMKPKNMQMKLYVNIQNGHKATSIYVKWKHREQI